MTLLTVIPQRAKRLIEEGASLIDVREAREYARERIPGARKLPPSRLAAAELAAHRDRPVIFHCRSGARTRGHAARLAACGSGGKAFSVESGLDAWRKAGLPVAADRRAPIELNRQVQIGPAASSSSAHCSVSRSARGSFPLRYSSAAA